MHQFINWQDLKGELSCNTTQNQQMLLTTFSSLDQMIPWHPAKSSPMIVYSFLYVLNYVWSTHGKRQGLTLYRQKQYLVCFIAVQFHLTCLRKKMLCHGPNEKLK